MGWIAFLFSAVMAAYGFLFYFKGNEAYLDVLADNECKMTYPDRRFTRINVASASSAGSLWRYDGTAVKSDALPVLYVPGHRGE